MKCPVFKLYELVQVTIGQVRNPLWKGWELFGHRGMSWSLEVFLKLRWESEDLRTKRTEPSPWRSNFCALTCHRCWENWTAGSWYKMIQRIRTDLTQCDFWTDITEDSCSNLIPFHFSHTVVARRSRPQRCHYHFDRWQVLRNLSLAASQLLVFESCVDVVFQIPTCKGLVPHTVIILEIEEPNSVEWTSKVSNKFWQELLAQAEHKSFSIRTRLLILDKGCLARLRAALKVLGVRSTCNMENDMSTWYMRSSYLQHVGVYLWVMWHNNIK